MSLKDFYERKYEKEEEKIHPIKFEAIKFLPNPPQKILDVGCGSGIISEILENQGYSVIGIDISHEGIKKAKMRGIEAYQHDIMSPLKFEDNYFDIIWMTEVIEHLLDPIIVLKELNRILKPNNMLLLTTPNSAFISRRILHLVGKTCTQIQNYSHIRFFNKNFLNSVLYKSGFSVENIYGFTRNPFYRHRGILFKKLINLIGNNFIVIAMKKDICSKL